MNRIELEKDSLVENIQLHLSDTNNYVIKWENFMNCNVDIFIKDDSKIDVLELGQNRCNNVNYFIGKNSKLKLTICSLDDACSTKYHLSLNENSSCEAAYADFDNGTKKCSFSFDLDGNYSSVFWHLASLSTSEDKKEFEISFNHNALNTEAIMDNYGVCENEATLTFSGVGYIRNGAKRAKAHQTAKIMVFDKNCNAKACPILKIDENDVEASHAATVGQVNEEHLFYLCSRGITKDDAKRLITLGYLNPIIKYFDEEEIASSIEKVIQRRV